MFTFSTVLCKKMPERHCKKRRAKTEQNCLSVIAGRICNSVQFGIGVFKIPKTQRLTLSCKSFKISEKKD